MPEHGAAIPTRAWARIVFRPGGGVVQASGSCEQILGAPARLLVESREPLKLLPAPLAAVLSSGIPDSPLLMKLNGFTGVLTPFESHVDLVLFQTEEPAAGGLSLFESLGAGVMGVDSAGVIRLWNSSMNDLFSLPGDTALGRNLEAVLPAPVLLSWSNVISAAMDGRHVKVELRPGQNRRVEATFRSGGPGVTGTFFDTSDSFQTERRLRTARRMNQTYLQAVRTGIVMFGPDYRLLVANKAFGDLFGLREVLLGVPVYEIVPPESFAEIEKSGRALFDGDQALPPSTVSFRDREGGWKAVHQTFRPVRSEDEDSFLVVGVFEDITGQMKAELEIEQEKVRQALLSSLVSLASTCSLPGDAGLVSERLAACIGATAVAVYLFEPYSSTRLAGSWGSWNPPLPEDFADLRLPPSVWAASPGIVLAGSELGALKGRCECCGVHPVGRGSSNRGFIVASFDHQNTASGSMHPGGMVADLISLRLDSTRVESQLEHVTYLLEKHRRFLKEVVSAIDIPLAVFGEDWRVLHWNRAMELLTGCGLETARKRSGTILEMLFGSVGGVAAARRLARRTGAGQPPAVWEIRRLDGTAVSAAWSMARADAADKDKVEPATILAGSPLEADAVRAVPGGGPDARVEMILRGMTRLVMARSASQLAEALASTAAALAGTDNAEVELFWPDGSSRARHSLRPEEPLEAAEPIHIVSGTRRSGSLRLPCDTPDSSVADLVRASARILEQLDEAAIGSEVAAVFGGSVTGFLVCDHSGRLLQAGWRPREDTGDLAGATGAGRAEADAALETAVKHGRSWLASPGDSPGWVLFSLGLPGRANLVFAWPVSREASVDLVPGYAGSSSAAGSVLADLLSALLASLRARFQGISRILSRDDPVKPEIRAASAELSSLVKTSRYIHMLEEASGPVSGVCHPKDLMERFVGEYVKAGRRPPDLEIEDGLPRIGLAGPVLYGLINAAAEVGGQGGSTAISVSRHSPAGASGRWTGSVCFRVEWRPAPVALMSLQESLDLIRSGAFTPGSELALVGLAARMCSCGFEAPADGLSVSFIARAAEGAGAG